MEGSDAVAVELGDDDRVQPAVPLEQIRSAIATIDDVWLLVAEDIFSA